MRFRFEKVIRDAQDSICAAIEEVDGTKFRQVRKGGAAAWGQRGGGCMGLAAWGWLHGAAARGLAA
jgi:hypothetical protein